MTHHDGRLRGLGYKGEPNSLNKQERAISPPKLVKVTAKSIMTGLDIVDYPRCEMVE